MAWIPRFVCHAASSPSLPTYDPFFLAFSFVAILIELNSYIRLNVKTRAELEEIALAEADVARLKQKVAELHCQLNLQRRHHFGLLSDTSVRCVDSFLG